MRPLPRKDLDTVLLTRIVADYREMPGLRLTVAQAVRLWNLETDHCFVLLETLVAQGVLARTLRGDYVDARAGP